MRLVGKPAANRSVRLFPDRSYTKVRFGLFDIYLVVEVQHVGAVSPLGEDDGLLLLPLQTATLGNFAGLRGDVVLQRKGGELLRRHAVIQAD